MPTPYKHPFPFPKENFSSPWVYEIKDTRYPFPIPKTELYPEYPWPKSLCAFAPECSISDDFSDLDEVKNCIHAYKHGCPLYLTEFAEFEEFGECSNIQIFEIGQTESKSYKEKDLDKIIENFDKLKETHRPPMIVLGHGEDQDMLKKSGLPSAGWVSKVWREGKQLVADFTDVPKKIVDLIKNKAYRLPSIEVYRNFIFDEKNFGPVLRRVALLGADIPRIKSLDDITARYGEGLNLPVQSDLSFQSDSIDEIETLWLGGKIMNKVTIPIKSISGNFTKDEGLYKGDTLIGTFEESTKDTLILMCDVDSLKLNDEDKITGKDSKAEATVGEKGMEIELDISDVEGAFEEDEDISGDDPEFFAKVKKIAPTKLVIFIIDEKKRFKKGEIIVGKKSKAKARVGLIEINDKYKPGTYPYPKPTKAEEKLTQLQERFTKLEAEAKTKDTQINGLKTDATVQKTKLDEMDQERFAEKLAGHEKSVELYFEDLRRKGLAPAIIDEGGLKAYALKLDWQTLLKFAEKEDEKTPWTKFSEVLDGIVTAQKENKLFVPLDELGQVIEADEVIGEGEDAEAVKMNRKIEEYAKEKSITFSEAYEQMSAEDLL